MAGSAGGRHLIHPARRAHEALLQHLIARFVDQAYSDDRSRENTLYWLAWLARRLRGQPDVAWWRIPEWLPGEAYGTFYGSVTGLGAGVLVGLATILTAESGRAIDPSAAVHTAWIAALVIGTSVGASVSTVTSPSAPGPSTGGADQNEAGPTPAGATWVAEPRALSPRRPGSRNLLTVGATVREAVECSLLAAGSVSIASVAVFAVMGFGQTFWGRVGHGVTVGLAAVPAALVIGTVTAVLIGLFTRSLTDSSATTPSRSYSADGVAVGVFVVVALLVAAALAVALIGFDGIGHPPLSWLLWLLPDPWFVAWLLAVGLGGSTVTALAVRFATHAVPSVKVAELLLWIRHGRRVRFRALLDAAVTRQVLRQTGAVYQFRHAAIQEHVAALETPDVRWLRTPWLRPALLAFVAAILVAGAGIGTVAVRNKPFLGLPGFTDKVRAVAVAPDGGTIAAGGVDRAIRIVDIDTGAVLRTLTGHTNAVVGIAIAPAGDILASRDSDDTVRVWDFATGRLRHSFELRNSDHSDQVLFSPDGTLLAAPDGKSVQLWDPVSGAALRAVAAQEIHVSAIWFGADGRELVTSDSFSGRPIRWQLATGRRAGDLPGAPAQSMSRDGSKIVLDDGPLVFLVDATTGDQIRQFRTTARVVDLSPDGGTMAVIDDFGGAWLWDTSTGHRRRLTRPDDGQPAAVTFTPDGKTLAVAVDQRILLWRTDMARSPARYVSPVRTGPTLGTWAVTDPVSRC